MFKLKEIAYVTYLAAALFLCIYIILTIGKVYMPNITWLNILSDKWDEFLAPPYTVLKVIAFFSVLWIIIFLLRFISFFRFKHQHNLKNNKKKQEFYLNIKTKSNNFVGIIIFLLISVVAILLFIRTDSYNSNEYDNDNLDSNGNTEQPIDLEESLEGENQVDLVLIGLIFVFLGLLAFTMLLKSRNKKTAKRKKMDYEIYRQEYLPKLEPIFLKALEIAHENENPHECMEKVSQYLTETLKIIDGNKHEYWSGGELIKHYLFNLMKLPTSIVSELLSHLRMSGFKMTRLVKKERYELINCLVDLTNLMTGLMKSGGYYKK